MMGGCMTAMMSAGGGPVRMAQVRMAPVRMAQVRMARLFIKSGG